ncbi:MAG: hypothetical protein N2999_01405 [Proteobacteria bacterium]|nr:hypothetical protein [Pseudomonadota bacterium]
MTERAYFIEDKQAFSLLPKTADRIYTGSDYCIKAFPKYFSSFLKLLKKTAPVSLLIPPLLESEIKLFHKYLEKFTDLANEEDEIICNDLGALKVLSSLSIRDRFKIGLGRFYSYQKRGVQKLYDAVKAEDLMDIPILDPKTIIFLKSLGVERVEIDAVPYGINIPDDIDIKISLYEDNLLTSYTINCPHTFNGRYWGRECKRQCMLSYIMVLSSEEITAKIVERGKAYYQNTEPTKSDKIDRIVRFMWKNIK